MTVKLSNLNRNSPQYIKQCIAKQSFCSTIERLNQSTFIDNNALNNIQLATKYQQKAKFKIANMIFTFKSINKKQNSKLQTSTKA